MRIAYSAVLITKDRPSHAIETVSAILRQHRLPARVVVIDASTPPLELPAAVSERAAALGVDLLLMPAEPNTGAQRNIGVERVETETTLVIDDDVVIPDDYAERLLARWETIGLEEIGGVVGAKEIPIDRVHRIVRGALGFSFDEHRGSPRMRRSGNMIDVPDPGCEVYAEAVPVGANLYRTDLLRRFPFEERFPGYVLGEDLDMSYRIGRAAPILVSPCVYWEHRPSAVGRDPLRQWYGRSRHDAFFRWRRIERSPVGVAAFGWSLAAEAVVAGAESVRARDRRLIGAYLRGFRDWSRDARAGVGSEPPASRPRPGLADSAV